MFNIVFHVCPQMHNLNFLRVYHDCTAANLFTTLLIPPSFLDFFPPPVAMEKQIEDLKQQLEKQCLINKELQRQNKDLGEHGCNNITL